MNKDIKSPKENVAQKTIVAIQTATTKLKSELITNIMFGRDVDELTKELNKIIHDCCLSIDNKGLREEIRKSLITSSRKWYYQFKTTITVLETNAKKAVDTFKEETLTLKIAELLKGKASFDFNAIRPVLTQTRKGLAIIADYEEKLKIALKALATEPPKIVRVAETAGRKGYAYTMSARNRAEMTVRYEANIADIQRFINDGVEYVWISSHPDASPRCAPHQGKLYSINANNKRGIIDGHRYTYLPDILQLNEGNSILNGYNCRHRAIAYTKGSHPPQQFTKEEIKKEYAIDQRQRYYENNIRKIKSEEELLRLGGFTKEANRLKRRWMKLEKNYEIYSLENGRAFYRWRCAIDQEELTT